ncbi:peptidase M48 Ste24p [Thermodesulfatator indicus DSM 15286]|uniref:Peptidase M48 Ste24p n=1 Tax=Thermodesulfatator indicus (strain DSM 15286 / JCM 11887 / CIR29812) TaxID=667014 RepID=F8A8L9_THEID|nr:M48 family metallopeptidase [Thermodesulfatator indicus]AEH45107.1 peptidase M48 Ste24p [Thermodesulfatator indicus DSM 15286]
MSRWSSETSKKFILVFVFLFLLYGCATAPVTGRKQLILVDPQTEIKLGLQAYEEILKKEKLCNDPTINALVQRVGMRIAKASGKNYDWEFKVIDKPESINAFCLPGGKVFVYTGILPVAQNEAGLATVLAHEIAHAIARHGAERMSIAMVAAFGEVLAAELLDLNNSRTRELFMAAYGLGATVGLILPYSRKQEYEADTIGLYLMAKAGYDPREAIKFWERMRQAASGRRKIPEFLSTHPADGKRIQALKNLLPQVLPIYEKAEHKYGLGEKIPEPHCR